MESPRPSFVKQNHGTIAMWFLFSLPLIFSLGVFILTTFFQIERDSQAQRLCYKIFFQAQRESAHWIDELLRLNPRSTLLKTQHEQALQELEIALASGQPSAISFAEARVAYYHAKRLTLEMQQKNLIAQVHKTLFQSENDSVEQLKKYFDSSDQKIRNRLNSKTGVWIEKKAEPGVSPVSPDLAPNYRLVPDIDRHQKLKINWRNQRFASLLFKRFISSSIAEEKSCAVSPFWKNHSWYFSVDQDKFW